jgi:hypothetical protein
MRYVMIGLALLIAVAGLVWLLQGINVLPGSYMTGDPFWAWTGLVCLVGGLTVAAFAWRRKPRA